MAPRWAMQDAAADLCEHARALYGAAGDVGSAARVTFACRGSIRLRAVSVRRSTYGAGLSGGFGGGSQRGLRDADDASGRRVYFTDDVPRACRAGRAVSSTSARRSIPCGRAPCVAAAMKDNMGTKGRRPQEDRGESSALLRTGQPDRLEPLRGNDPSLLRTLSDLAFRRDRCVDALAHLDQAASLARVIGDRPHRCVDRCSQLKLLSARHVVRQWDKTMAVYASCPRALPDIGTCLLSRSARSSRSTPTAATSVPPEELEMSPRLKESTRAYSSGGATPRRRSGVRPFLRRPLRRGRDPGRADARWGVRLGSDRPGVGTRHPVEARGRDRPRRPGERQRS